MSNLGKIYCDMCFQWREKSCEHSECAIKPLDIFFEKPIKIMGHEVELVEEKLTNEEIVIISNYIANDYVPHEEPARSAILKLHRIAEKYR